MQQGGVNSFFRFVFGFTIFIAVSLGVTYAVTMIEIDQQKEEQTAAALDALLGAKESEEWWEFWK